MREYPGDRIGVVCALSLVEHVVKLGVDRSRILNFYGNRGRNSLEDCDAIYIVGRPERPDTEAFALANVLHKGEAPVLPHTTMKEVAYAGYRAPDGMGRAHHRACLRG